MKEQWTSIRGFSNYLVSNLGNVKNMVTNKLLTPCPNKGRRGYVYVSVQQGGKRRNYLLSRLVANHFIPNPENKTQVNHKDGNKSNNSVDNLEWVTSLENIHHAIKNHLTPGSKTYSITSTKRKIKEHHVLSIRNLARVGVSYKEIANKYKLGFSTVVHIVNGTRWAWLKEGIYHKYSR